MKDEVVVKVENGDYVHLWFSSNESATEGCDACIDYEVYDENLKETDLGGGMDYNSAGKYTESIEEAIEDVLDFIYDKKLIYEVICESMSLLKEKAY